MYKIPNLPLAINFSKEPIFKKLILANRALAELKGISGIIPNESILINTLALQEAKDSSAVENIITTHDELYKCDSQSKYFTNSAAKEVHKYAEALRDGYQRVRKNKLLTNRDILEIQSTIVGSRAGVRTLPGTALKNEKTGATVYTPPQEENQIRELMDNLEQYINNETLDDSDPLIKMAIIHHQFESIHPFYDGNGRTGRILNVLYLVKNDLLHSPILYLSRYINQHKGEYYRLLQAVREQEDSWNDWLLFILDGIIQTSYQTIGLIQEIKNLMQEYKVQIREKLPKIYSQDLLNNLFRHPYTKIEFVTNELQVHRNTAKKYLEGLDTIGMVEKQKMGKENFYINKKLFDLLQKSGENNLTQP